MHRNKECYFLGVVGTMNARKSVFWLYENAKLTNGGWLAANVKEALNNLSRHDGLETFKDTIDLRNHKASLFGVPIALVTKKNLPKDRKNQPLAALEPTDDFLDELDKIPNISKMVVAPLITDEVDNWALRNKAQDLDNIGMTDESRRQIQEASRRLDKVVLASLKHLTTSIESYYAEQLHPSILDKFGMITSTLYRLRENGYDINPAVIRNCLIENYNWKPVSAKLVEDIGESTRSGEELFKGYSGYWDNDIIIKWKEESKML